MNLPEGLSIFAILGMELLCDTVPMVFRSSYKNGDRITKTMRAYTTCGILMLSYDVTAAVLLAI